MWFGLLGPLRVCMQGLDVPVPAPKQRVLLAALLLSAGKAVSCDRLAELVWDGTPPDGAAVTLRSYVKRLRQLLGPDGGSRIITRWGGYVIECAEDDFDVTQYEALCGLAEAAVRAGAWQRAERLLSRAQGLWRGAPLTDIPSQALQVAEVPRLEQLWLQATQWRIDADLRLGRCAKVVPELSSLTAEHPLREPFHHQLMTALYQCGRTADALAAFRRARDALISEIGIEPGPDLQQLHQRMLAGDPELAITPATELASAPARLAPPPRHLPPPVQGFVGRAAGLRELADLLDAWAANDGATMIGVISGPAGVGKTALAVHWAHQVADAFPDGQLYLDLNGFSPAGTPVTQAQAISKVFEALQVPTGRIPANLPGQADFYRDLLSQRRLLLILDNARDADQVRPLLPGGAGCLVVITGRSQLTGLVAVNGARPLLLTVFSDEEAREMVVRRLRHRVTNADQAATNQLVAACGHLPLALAIATALIATRLNWSLAAAASELARADLRLDALNAGEEIVNLRSVFDWSYWALNPAAARMFRLLAEHPGPDISRAAAVSLAGLPPRRARDALAELTGLHLVTEPESGRFSLHDLLRLYAAEILRACEAPAERHAARQRMLDHYLRTAWTAARAINPSRDAPPLPPPAPGTCPEDLADDKQAARWLAAEHQVLVRLIGYAAGVGADVHAWQLSLALTDFLDRAGHWSDFAASQQTALAAALRLNDLAAQAHAHRYIGRACFHLQDADTASAHLIRALELWHDLVEPAREAGVSIDLGHVHLHQGDVDRSMHYFRHALRLSRSLGDRTPEAIALNNLGWCHALKQNYPEALTYCERALELSVQLGNQAPEGMVSDSLGYIYQHLGQPVDAIASYQRALAIFRDLGDRYFTAMTLDHLGDAHQVAGDLPHARGAWRQALVIYDDLDHPDGEALRQKLDKVGCRASHDIGTPGRDVDVS